MSVLLFAIHKVDMRLVNFELSGPMRQEIRFDSETAQLRE